MNARRFVAVLLVLMVGAVAASAQTQTVYNSIPKPLPGNVASFGPEAYAFAEVGDGFELIASSGTIGQVTVIMSSWACETGSWTSGCVTTPGATFSQPITVNLYSVNDGPIPGPQLGSITQTFNIPYRPSSDTSRCGTRWYSSKDKACYNGLAVPIVVNFSNLHVAIPSNGKLIVTVAFNTNTAGPFPTHTPGPYDSLNVSTDGNGSLIGTVLDGNGIFVNYISSYAACPGNTTTGSLVLDTGAYGDGSGCWAGYHPMIQVQANTNATHGPKGNAP